MVRWSRAVLSYRLIFRPGQYSRLGQGRAAQGWQGRAGQGRGLSKSSPAVATESRFSTWLVIVISRIRGPLHGPLPRKVMVTPREPNGWRHHLMVFHGLPCSMVSSVQNFMLFVKTILEWTSLYSKSTLAYRVYSFLLGG